MRVTSEQLINCKWFVVADDLIGGYAIATVDKPCSAIHFEEGEFVPIMMPLGKEVAQHLVDLHNSWGGF